MYLLYIDDSGSCDLKKDEVCMKNGGTNSRYFVLGSILIKAHELNRIEPQIEYIRTFCLGDNSKELKHSVKSQNMYCIINCNKDMADISCYKKNIANLISSVDCTIFVAYQDKYLNTKGNIVKSKNDIYRLSFEHLIKSVDDFMYNNNIKEDVIVFIDKKDGGSEKDKLIYKSYKQALENKKIFKAFNNTIFSPTINIVYSQFTSGCQLADFIAGSVWNFLENKDNKETQEKMKEFTKLYSEKVYQKDGKLLGYRKCDKFLQ